ncbi:hypothetical protein RIF29_35691 [Crotalaria pallida]|uniref:Glycosyltransferase n=1 Tax=Crotalaria pallida TaxID=3830 RepID=A0AAN9ECG9_CROPI
MGTQHNDPLHILLFPFLAHGHMIPVVDMAKLFASKGVRATIITTPINAPFISKSIENSKSHSNMINIQTIKFPCAEVGLPEGCENANLIPSPDYVPVFLKATELLQKPFEQHLNQHKPNCVVADMFFPWATDSCSKFRVPRIVFHGISFFSLCANECVFRYRPYENVSSDSESFVIPNLPGEIKMTRLQVSEYFRNDDFKEAFRKIHECNEKSYGVVVNSFYELEQNYADYYREVIGRRAWHIGPLSLCNNDKEEKIYRGKEASIDEHEWQKFLGSKKACSIVYVSFGSMIKFSDYQLREIAMGLEASGQHFIWVVRRSKEDGAAEWLPEGFEKRMEGKGLIIRGWAPQVLILEHEAIGAFVTHCGWNSTLEAITAGVPMVTWPVSAEQFYNEKFVIEVLKIGVPVGVKKWAPFDAIDYIIKYDAIKKVVNNLMTKEEALMKMRSRAKVFSRLAKRAVEEGGSSSSDLNALIDELVLLR